jgi:hypothetical protein
MLALACLILATPSATAQPPGIEWIAYPDERNIGWIEYSGGALDNLLDDLGNEGCEPAIIYIHERRVGYLVDLPTAAQFVNRPFLQAYAGNIPVDTTITVKCTAFTPVAVEADLAEQIPDYNLDPTYVQWITYPEINTDRNKQGNATVQYGGGSFYQLISRLSIEGCETINLKIDDLEYDFRHPNQQNQAFKDRYTENIEQNTRISIQCIDNCEVVYAGSNVSDWRNLVTLFEGCIDFEYSPEVIASHTDCKTDWSSDVQKALRRIPVLQDICKVEAVSKRERGGYVIANIFFLHENIVAQTHKSTITLVGGSKNTDFENDWWSFTKIHEICHVHQNWYTLKQHIDDDHLNNNKVSWAERRARNIHDVWYETDMAQEFIQLTEFEDLGEGQWRFDNNTIKARTSHTASSPVELSADVCALYLLKHTNIENKQYEGFTKPPHLTPELEQWVEKYIVLPE